MNGYSRSSTAWPVIGRSSGLETSPKKAVAATELWDIPAWSIPTQHSRFSVDNRGISKIAFKGIEKV
jgi:hypothetical protein